MKTIYYTVLFWLGYPKFKKTMPGRPCPKMLYDVGIHRGYVYAIYSDHQRESHLEIPRLKDFHVGAHGEDHLKHIYRLIQPTINRKIHEGEEVGGDIDDLIYLVKKIINETKK